MIQRVSRNDFISVNWSVGVMYQLTSSHSDVGSTSAHGRQLVASLVVGASWNAMAHAQKSDFISRAKRTSPFKSAKASVQSTTGSRGVRISGSNAGYTMFRGSVKGTGYPLHSPVSPFTSPPMRTPQTIAVSSDALSDLRSSKKVKKIEIRTFSEKPVKLFFVGMKRHWDECCWAMTLAAWGSRCHRSWPSILEVGFQLSSGVYMCCKWPYAYSIPQCAKFVLGRTVRCINTA